MPVTRWAIWSRSACSSRPFSTCLSRDLASEATIASALLCWRDRRITSTPALAATSAMPDPMIPDPTIPKRLMLMARSYRPVVDRFQTTSPTPNVRGA